MRTLFLQASRRLVLLMATIVWATSLLSVGQDHPPVQPTRASAAIGLGDILDIAIFDEPELSGKLRVDDDGTVALPLIGKTKVAGLTTDEARAFISKQLSDGNYIKAPQVSLMVVEYGSEGITVIGEVKKPGVYPPTGSMTVLEVLSKAEGLTPLAGPNVVIRHRGAPEHPEMVSLVAAPDKLLASATKLQPGDVVYVPKAGLVYVVGDVGKPGGFIMDQGSTSILQALAMAGGYNKTASLRKARIIRNGEAGPVSIDVDLKQIVAMKAPDAPMTAGDVLFVPDSLSKSAMRRSAEAILQITTGAAIYRAF